MKSLNSSNGVIEAIIQGTIIGVVKGDTRRLDYGSLDFYRSQFQTCLGTRMYFRCGSIRIFLGFRF